MASVTVKIKFLTIAKGKPYFRRRGWKTVPLRSAVDDTEGLRAEIAELLRTDGQKQLPPAGSLGRLILDYQASPYWTDLAPASQEGYGKVFKQLRGLYAAPIAAMDRAWILRARDQKWHPKHGWWQANRIVTVLGILFRFAHDKGLVRHNPLAERVRAIRRPKDARTVNRPWTAQERAAVLSHAPPDVRLPLVIAMCTGMRKADVFRLTWNDIQGDEIRVTTQKRGTPLRLPIHPVLAQALAETPRTAVQVCPIKSKTFDVKFWRLKQELKSEGLIGQNLTMHGMRHSLGTMLAEQGMPDDQIRRVLAQQSIEMARKYSSTAQLSEDTRATITKLDFGK